MATEKSGTTSEQRGTMPIEAGTLNILPPQFTNEGRLEVNEVIDITYSNPLEKKDYHELLWDNRTKAQNIELDLTNYSNPFIVNLDTFGVLAAKRANFILDIKTNSGNPTSNRKVCLEDVYRLFHSISVHDAKDPSLKKIMYSNRNHETSRLLQHLSYGEHEASHARRYGYDCYDAMTAIPLDGSNNLSYRCLFNPFAIPYLSEQFKQFDGFFNLKNQDLRITFDFASIRDAFSWNDTQDDPTHNINEQDITVTISLTPYVNIYNFKDSHPLTIHSRTDFKQMVQRCYYREHISSESYLDFQYTVTNVGAIDWVLLLPVLQTTLRSTSHGRFDKSFSSEQLEAVRLIIDGVEVDHKQRAKTFDKLILKHELHEMIGNDVSAKKSLVFHDDKTTGWDFADDGSNDGKIFYLWNLSCFTNAVSGLGTEVGRPENHIINFRINRDPNETAPMVYKFIVGYKDFVEVRNDEGTLEMSSKAYHQN